MCAGTCDIVSLSTSEIKCLTPPNNGTGSTEICDITVIQDSGNVTKVLAERKYLIKTKNGNDIIRNRQ